MRAPQRDLPANCITRTCDNCGQEWIVSPNIARRLLYLCPRCSGKKMGKRQDDKKEAEQ